MKLSAYSASTIRSVTMRKLLLTSALAFAGMVHGSAALALDDNALPQGEQVVGGDVTFDRSTPNRLDVSQGGNRAVIDWDSFNIGKNATTEFHQNSSKALVVNRVTGNNADPTQILGTLKANGRVMVLDRNGVLFGQDSVIDVGGIVASTGDVDSQKIMNGDNKLELTNFGNGTVENRGTVNVGDAGLAAFVAPTVKNSGTINAKLGKVALASGEKVTVDLYGDNLVSIAADDKTSGALIDNAGTIDAAGGVVQMTTAAASGLVDNVINVNGVVRASFATQQGGKIILSGDRVNVGGEVTAQGGAVNVTADTAVIDSRMTAKTVTGAVKNVKVASSKASIQQGIDMTAKGGLVDVAAGTYNEDVVMATEGVTLRGAKAGIQGSSGLRGSNETVIRPTDVGVRIVADDTTVNGLTVDGANSAGIWVQGADNVTLAYNVVKNSANIGIRSRLSDNSTMTYNYVDNARIGMLVQGGDNDALIRNTINHVTTGMRVTDTTGATVGHNVVHNGKGYGMILADNSAGDVRYNRIYDVNGDGINDTSSSNMLYRANRIYNVGGDGIELTNADGVTLQGNFVGSDIDDVSKGANNVKGDGIKVTNANKASITGNHVHGVAKAGLRLTNLTNATVGRESSNSNDFSNWVDGATDGIVVSGGSNNAITKNLIDHVSNSGIRVSDSDGAYLLRNHTMRGVNGFAVSDSDNVTLRSNVAEYQSGNGIVVEGSDNVSLRTNRVGRGDIGMHIGAGNGLVTLIGNRSENNRVGGLFESGLIDLTGAANSFTGGDVGMRFAPVGQNATDLRLRNDTIGGTSFAGQSQFYVQLANGALYAPGTPTIVDGSKASYDGLRPSMQGNVMTQAEFDGLESAVYHWADDATLGLFFMGTVQPTSPQQPGTNVPGGGTGGAGATGLGIDEEDIFNEFGQFTTPPSALNVTILGLPRTSPIAATELANIAPAAGDDAAMLASLEPAAGGDNETIAANNTGSNACWGDALAGPLAGPVSYSFGTGLNEALTGIANCQTGQF